MSRAVSGPPTVVPLSSIVPDADGNVALVKAGLSFRTSEFNGDVSLGFLCFGPDNAGVPYDLTLQPIAGDVAVPDGSWVNVGTRVRVKGVLENLGEAGGAMEVPISLFGDHKYGSVSVEGVLPTLDESGGPATPSFLLFAVLTEPRRMSTPQPFQFGKGSAFTVADDLTVTVLSDADGTTPVAGATVTVTDALGIVHEKTSDVDGLAVFVGLPDDQAGVTSVVAVKGAKSRTQIMPLFVGQPPPGNIITLIPAAPAGALVVTVLAAAEGHAPVEGATVRVTLTDGGDGIERTTGALGTATYNAGVLLAMAGVTIYAEDSGDTATATKTLGTGANTQELTLVHVG